MPTLSPEQIAQLQKEKAMQENIRDGMAAAVPAAQARADELQVADSAFKVFFDYYNDDIIGKYDAERKALDGQYIADPITEADVIGPASLDGAVRTSPSTPVTDIIRVDEFDGGPLVSTNINETQHIADQAYIENVLVNGYGAPHFNPATAKTASILNSGSTSLQVTDPTNPLTIVANDVFLVTSGTDTAVVKVTSVTTPAGMTPPYNATYAIQVLAGPNAPIASGEDLDDFTGFTNTERTNKVTTDPLLQDFMDYLIDELEVRIVLRQARLAEQLSAISTNQDPDGTAALATATTNVNTSNSFLTNYLLTTVISDAGLASLSTERGTRGAQITARVAAITAAYTGQTQNYYDARYNFANNRGNTSRGTLRLYYNSTSSVTQLQNYSAGAQDAIDAIDSLLP